ncbi:MAG TPA: universal stress protein [Gammaproteobacteria bacterium]|nr:universal stress protein [Gammaproteobacteria bacterium]
MTEPVAPFIRSVVHATDFSAADERAFAHALGVALLVRADFTILHVTSDPSGDWRGFPAVRKTLERWKLLEPGSAQEAVFAKLGVAVRKITLESRFPASAVAQHLENEPADLLVVATEGREGVARWMHGSVAEAMARRSRTMTLFVPTDAERNIVALSDGNLALENVLIPVERAQDAGAAIEFARRAAMVMSDSKATITLLHVGDGSELSSLQLEDGPQWTFARLQRDGEPVDEIVAAAELVRADLIVMPTEGRHGVFDALRGSTTERVLRRSRCPVLAVPAART